MVELFRDADRGSEVTDSNHSDVERWVWIFANITGRDLNIGILSHQLAH